jgi:sucrose-6-phosphate hydrolase SacC (GH32 family)
MKRIIILYIAVSFVFVTAYGQKEVFKDAVAFWSFSNLNDLTIANSKLEKNVIVQLVNLEKQDLTASKDRDGDGKAIKLDGHSWLDAGQGINDELNINGKAISILIRMRADSLKDFNPLLTKSGDDQSIAYSVALDRDGEDVFIKAMLGSDDIGGAHLLKYKLPVEDLYKWHDIIFRFNGKRSELYIDGFLRDDEITEGEVRDWNRRPFLVGATCDPAYVYGTDIKNKPGTTFSGLIDCIGIWDRYLSDKELASFSGKQKLTDGRPVYYNEKYRPQFHFSATKNWLNDPNGLFYYNGTYHMFFQYMPPHRPGAYKDWGHAISTDLVHWKQIPNHITPHKVWGGCWSGSAVVDINNTSGFKTGEQKPIVAFITNGGDPKAGLGPMNTQCIAYSTDGGNTFVYYDQNPVIKNIHNANRDPKVVWDQESKKWIMSLYMDQGSDFGLFASSDLKDWKYLSTVTLEGVTECPGFLPLPVDGNTNDQKWLFFGANGDYKIGTFDGKIFTPLTKVLRGDYGKNFYAAQTWENTPDDRCVLIAWMPTKRYPGMPFEQQMNFPTELRLKTTPEGLKLFRTPIDEISKLYNKETKWDNVVIKPGDNLFKNLKGDLYDINVEVGASTSSFTIGARGATIHYDASSNLISCGGPTVDNSIKTENNDASNNSAKNLTNNLGEALLLPRKGAVKLRILIDRTTIEVFGNDGEVVITSCFMPAANDDTYFFKSEGKVSVVKAQAYSLKSSWIK